MPYSSWPTPNRTRSIGPIPITGSMNGSRAMRRLARKIWEGSGKTLNPRYLYGHYKIINRLKLLELVDEPI